MFGRAVPQRRCHYGVASPLSDKGSGWISANQGGRIGSGPHRCFQSLFMRGYISVAMHRCRNVWVNPRWARIANEVIIMIGSKGCRSLKADKVLQLSHSLVPKPFWVSRRWTGIDRQAKLIELMVSCCCFVSWLLFSLDCFTCACGWPMRNPRRVMVATA